MTHYDDAMRGLREVFQAIPRLCLESGDEAKVLYLVGRAALHTDMGVLSATQHPNIPEGFEQAADLVKQIQRYELRAHELDPSGSYREILPIHH
jgi:hypothetical protein